MDDLGDALSRDVLEVTMFENVGYLIGKRVGQLTRCLAAMLGGDAPGDFFNRLGCLNDAVGRPLGIGDDRAQGIAGG